MKSKQMVLTKGSSYYLNGHLSTGVYITKNNRAIVIDPGINASSAKVLVKALKERNVVLDSVIISHYHADHCGAVYYLQNNHKKFYPEENQPLKVYSAQVEQNFVENPYLVSSCLCGMGEPSEKLRTINQIEAQPARVTHPIAPYDDCEIIIDNEAFKVVTLKGHTHGMIGVVTPDSILYCGDAIFGDDALKKHGILFYTHIPNSLATFEKLEQLDIEGCVMYHGGFEKSIKNRCQAHFKRLLQTKESIFNILKSEPGLSYDMITARYLKQHNIPSNILTCTLTRTCVVSYITMLESEHRCELIFRDGLITPRVNTLEMVEHYEMISNKKECRVRFYFSNNSCLTGDSALDAPLIGALNNTTNYLKYIGFLANKDTTVVPINNNLKNYQQHISYDNHTLGDLPRITPKIKPPVYIQLSETWFELIIPGDMKAKNQKTLHDVIQKKFKATPILHDNSEKKTAYSAN